MGWWDDLTVRARATAKQIQWSIAGKNVHARKWRKRTDRILVSVMGPADALANRHRFHALIYNNRVDRGVPIRKEGRHSTFDNDKTIGLCIVLADNENLSSGHIKTMRLQVSAWERAFGQRFEMELGGPRAKALRERLQEVHDVR